MTMIRITYSIRLTVSQTPPAPARRAGWRRARLGPPRLGEAARLVRRGRGVGSGAGGAGRRGTGRRASCRAAGPAPRLRAGNAPPTGAPRGLAWVNRRRLVLQG